MTQRRPIGVRILYWLSMGWLGFLCLPSLFGGQHPLMSLVGSVPGIAFACASLVLSALLVIARLNWINSALAILILLMGIGQLDWNWPRSERDTVKPTQGNSINVINWNTLMWDENKDTEAFYSFLQNANADVFILQEALYSAANHPSHTQDPRLSQPVPITHAVTGLEKDYLLFNKASELAKRFPGYFWVHHQQFLVLSRFPIVGADLDPSEQFQIVDIQVGESQLRLFNVHMILHLEFHSPFSARFYSALERRLRARQIGFRNLQTAIENTETDYLVAGDFNSPKAMGTMGWLNKNHDDAYRYGDQWLNHTFEYNGWRLWRFDYLFANKDRQFALSQFKNTPIPALSDHNVQRFTLHFPTDRGTP